MDTNKDHIVKKKKNTLSFLHLSSIINLYIFKFFKSGKTPVEP